MATGEAWERDWRSEIMRQLKESAVAHQQTAVTLERLNGRLDEHDRRLDALEQQPSSLRNFFGTYGGCLGQVVFAVLSGAGTIIAIASLVITLSR